MEQTFFTTWAVWFVIVALVAVVLYFMDASKGGYLDGYGKFMVGCLTPISVIIGSFCLALVWLAFVRLMTGT